MIKYSLITFFSLLNCLISYGQNDNLQLGKSTTLPSAAVYDLSDQNGVNMEVNLWGFVRFPGRYKVPIKTTFIDLMTYAGGPLENSNLEEIRLIRGATDTIIKKKEIVKLDYNDILWEDKVHVDSKRNPILQPGDVVVVMEQKKYFFRDDVMLIIPIIDIVVTVLTFMLTLKIVK